MNLPLNFSPVINTLQELALAKVSRILWQANSGEATSLIEWKRGLQHQLITDDNLDEACKILREKVKVIELPIPVHFRKDLHHYIDLTWSEINESIVMFMEVLDKFYGVGGRVEQQVICSILKYLPWGCYNTMDHREMAKIVLREHDKQLSVKLKYRLACYFCLEEDIRKIWTDLYPVHNCRHDLEAPTFWLEDIEANEDPITVLWSFLIYNRLDRLRFEYGRNKSPIQYVIEYMFDEELPLNEYAIKFLWSKLTDIEEDYLISIFKHHCDEMRSPGLLCFILSKMNLQNQVEILSYLPGFFLEKFLRHGYQHLFMPTLRVTWNSIDESDMSYIALTVDTDACPEEIKKQFWEEIPESNCKHLYASFSQRRCLALLKSPKSLQHIRRILNTAPELTVYLYILERCMERCLEYFNFFPKCSTQSKLDALNSNPSREIGRSSTEKLEILVPIIKDYLERPKTETWGALRKLIAEYMECPFNTEFQPWVYNSIPDNELEMQIFYTLEYLDKYLNC